MKNFIYTKNGSKTDKFMKHWQSFQNVEKLYSVSQIEPVSINYFNDNLINKIKNTCKIEKNLTVLPHPIFKNLKPILSKENVLANNQIFPLFKWLENTHIEFCGKDKIKKTTSL